MRIVVAAMLVCACGAGAGSGGTGGGGTNADSGSNGGVGGGVGGPSIDREALSGSRLRNRYIDGDDGSRTPYGFFDSTRNEPCFFTWAEDGKQRCLPTENAGGIAPATSGPFEDSACTTPLATGSCAANYAYTITSTCPFLFTIYATTPFIGSMVFYKSGSNCTAASPAANVIYAHVGAKVAPAEFVAGTIKHD